MDDAMEPLDDEDIEAEADSEVEKVLWELTEGKLGEAPRAVDDSLPASVRQPAKVSAAAAKKGPALRSGHDVSEDETEEDMETMRKRLEDLKN